MSDWEPPQCMTITRPKARKDHQCCECLGVIRKGEQYEQISGIWDDRPMRFKTCCDCEVLRDKYNAPLHWEDHAHLGGLTECISNSDDVELMRVMATTKRKRGRKVPQWIMDFIEDER